jgi:hypothetical protein
VLQLGSWWHPWDASSELPVLNFLSVICHRMDSLEATRAHGYFQLISIAPGLERTMLDQKGREGVAHGHEGALFAMRRGQVRASLL